MTTLIYSITSRLIYSKQIQNSIKSAVYTVVFLAKDFLYYKPRYLASKITKCLHHVPIASKFETIYLNLWCSIRNWTHTAFSRYPIIYELTVASNLVLQGINMLGVSTWSKIKGVGALERANSRKHRPNLLITMELGKSPDLIRSIVFHLYRDTQERLAWKKKYK